MVLFVFLNNMFVSLRVGVSTPFFFFFKEFKLDDVRYHDLQHDQWMKNMYLP